MTKRSEILGVGSYVPPKVWTNNDLTQLMDTSDEWIQQRTGIKQRHWVEGDTTTSDLALEATKKALDSAGVKKEEIDLIVFATICPDHEFPGTGVYLQRKLGIPGVGTLDIKQACTGFLTGMSIADQYIRTGNKKRVLVVGAEVHSKGLDRTTKGRDVAVLFGDGAGAIVMGDCEPKSDQDSCVLSTHFYADGTYADELSTPAPGMAYRDHRITKEMIDEGLHLPKMNGKLVFVNAVKKMPEALLEAVRVNDYKVEDVDLFILHQANKRINDAAAKTLGVPAEKVFNTIDRFGNTTAATIPIGLDEAVKAGKLKKGMLVASAAFGSGFSWASALFRW